MATFLAAAMSSSVNVAWPQLMRLWQWGASSWGHRPCGLNEKGVLDFLIAEGLGYIHLKNKSFLDVLATYDEESLAEVSKRPSA
ncbi:MAG: hypothetical protein R2865_10345 [Deinococcales bacterium]